MITLNVISPEKIVITTPVELHAHIDFHDADGNVTNSVPIPAGTESVPISLEGAMSVTVSSADGNQPLVIRTPELAGVAEMEAAAALAEEREQVLRSAQAGIDEAARAEERAEIEAAKAKEAAEAAKPKPKKAK